MSDQQPRFSQRIGLSPLEKIAQRESMDDDLRNGLWNVFYMRFFSGSKRYEPVATSPNLRAALVDLWVHYFKRPVDEVPKKISTAIDQLKHYFLSCSWAEVYDFMEHVARSLSGRSGQASFVAACNGVMERENSAYRFIGTDIVEVTSATEIEAVETALENAAPYPGVQAHLSAAVACLADRLNPDYRNSIKESICSIEAAAQLVTANPKATLGDALKVLEREGQLHGALKQAFTALYGYTSDADGIRHAMLEEPNLSAADAQFMLVVCSAFVSYLTAKTALG